MIASVIFSAGWNILWYMKMKWILFWIVEYSNYKHTICSYVGTLSDESKHILFSSDTCSDCKSNLIHAHANTLVITINIKLCKNQFVNIYSITQHFIYTFLQLSHYFYKFNNIIYSVYLSRNMVCLSWCGSILVKRDLFYHPCNSDQ